MLTNVEYKVKWVEGLGVNARGGQQAPLGGLSTTVTEGPVWVAAPARYGKSVTAERSCDDVTFRGPIDSTRDRA